VSDQGALFGPEPDDRKPWQGGAAYDLTKGEELRDQGITRALSNTGAEYRTMFERIVADFVRQGIDFTAEDVTARVGFPPAGTSPNAIGALTRGCAVRFGLVKIGRVKAQRSPRHANEIAVWGRRR